MPDTVYELQLLDGSFYPVSRDSVEKYGQLYPAVDVDQEFRKMIGWLDSHPKNRKTARGIDKFINGWLSRTQDSARPQDTPKTGPKNRFITLPRVIRTMMRSPWREYAASLRGREDNSGDREEQNRDPCSGSEGFDR